MPQVLRYTFRKIFSTQRLGVRLYQKFLIRTLIAFSPSILFFLLFDSTDPGASTAVAVAQGIVLLPFIAWMWVDFRRNPEKYPSPAWLIGGLDVALLGFVLLVVVYAYLERHGYI